MWTLVSDAWFCSNLENSSLKVVCFCSISCSTFLDTTTCCCHSFWKSFSMASLSNFWGSFCTNHTTVHIERTLPTDVKETLPTGHKNKYCHEWILVFFTEKFSVSWILTNSGALSDSVKYSGYRWCCPCPRIQGLKSHRLLIKKGLTFLHTIMYHEGGW